MYSISADAAHNLVHITLQGMMSVEEVDAYIHELKRTFVRERLHPGYRMILDVSACTIQSQEMIAAMGEHMKNMPKAAAIAVVTGSSLARMQIRRLFAQPYARIVADMAEARSWALHGQEPATKARGG